MNILILWFLPPVYHEGALGGFIRSEEVEARLKVLGVNVDYISPKLKPFKSFSSLRSLIWIIEAVAMGITRCINMKYHVILTRSHMPYNVFPAYLLRILFGIPVVVMVHHVEPQELQPNIKFIYASLKDVGLPSFQALVLALAVRLNKYVLKKIDAVIAVSKSTAEVLMEKLGIHAYVSYNGVDMPITASSHEGKKYDAIFVGRIDPSKGIWDLLEVWKKVLKTKPNARLVIVGGGRLDFIFTLNAQINCFPNGSVRYVGFVSNKIKHKMMHESKIMIFPSHIEGFGLTVAEAMKCGLPVIAYDLPALKEIYGRCEGAIFVPYRDYTGFAYAIIELLCDDELRSELGKRAVNSIETLALRYNWDKTAERDLLILKNVARVR